MKKMQCSSGHYGVSDMPELQMLAAGGATSPCMFDSASQEVPQLHQQQRQQHHLHHQQSSQQREIVQLYHRQAGLQQEYHFFPAEANGTQILLGLHHLQQKTVDSHLVPVSHPVSLGSEFSAEVAISPLAAPRTTSTTNHHEMTQYIQPMLASSRRVSTSSTAVEEYSDVRAEDAEKCALSGSRWPPQETLTPFQVRSQMDALCRDSAPKLDSLWEEVSRKLYNAGCQRSAEKCEEKFENVHKYYKKTKDGKAEKIDGKGYRSRTELEAIISASPGHEMEADVAISGEGSKALFSNMVANSAMQQLEGTGILQAGQETSTRPNSSSSTSCGNVVHAGVVESSEQQICGRKRKRSSWRSMRVFFDNLSKQLMERQDALHKNFLEAIERREEERARREEAYKRQEMARMSREQDLRAQEQVLAVRRDAALVAFLRKVTGETLRMPEMIPSVMDAAPGCNVVDAMTPSGEEPLDLKESSLDANCRRWPKVEVLALIRVRTSLEPRFQEAGPKAQLWEDVAFSMASLGFRRSSKRCKEKWENINKYYRKSKDNSGRKLHPDTATKTCPYFHQLDLLYERGTLTSPSSSFGINKSASKLDAPQTSGEFLESTSKDESQQTSTNPDCQQVSSIPFVQTSTNLQAADDGMSVAVASSCNGAPVYDTNAGGKVVDPKAGSYLSESAQININCEPLSHLSVMAFHQQVHAHEEHRIPNKASTTELINEGSHFVKEMLEIQHHHHQVQQRQQQMLPTEPVFERHLLIASHKEHSAGATMQDLAGEQEIGMRMHHQDGMPRLNHKFGHHDNAALMDHRDNATLMALVHKLASVDGHPDFDVSSPANSECPGDSSA